MKERMVEKKSMTVQQFYLTYCNAKVKSVSVNQNTAEFVISNLLETEKAGVKIGKFGNNLASPSSSFRAIFDFLENEIEASGTYFSELTADMQDRFLNSTVVVSYF